MCIVNNLNITGFLVLRFNVPVNNFSVMLGRNHRFLGINQYFRELMCLAQEDNRVTLVGIEPRTSRFGVQRSTTRPLYSNNRVSLVTWSAFM